MNISKVRKIDLTIDKVYIKSEDRMYTYIQTGGTSLSMSSEISDVLKLSVACDTL